MRKLEDKEIENQLSDLGALKWLINEDQSLEKTFETGSFKESILLVNKVSELAEEEGHHPDIQILYDVVVFTISTHDVGGITKKDIKMAAKIDKLAK